MLHGHVLRIYDFDGTLFRSPQPPERLPEHDQYAWLDSTASLSPPAVPKVPGDEWWVPEPEALMREDLKHRGRAVMVLTGRKELHRPRIGRLLFDRGLVPNSLFLNDTDRPTRDHKIQKMLRALRINPRIKKIDMWEDNHDDVEHFRAFFEAQGVPFTVHHVNSTPMPRQT